MKNEKKPSDSSGNPVLPEIKPESATAAVKRVNPPGLATVAVRRLARSEGTASRLLNRVCGHRPGALQAAAEPTVDDEQQPTDELKAEELQSYLHAAKTGHQGSLYSPPAVPTGALQRLESLKSKLPARLIIAVCLLIAAIITGFYAPRPPL